MLRDRLLGRPLPGLAIILLAFTPGLLAGCAPPPLLHADFGERVRLIRIVALAPPDLKIYRLGATGGTELGDEGPEQARSAVTGAMEGALAEKGITITEFAPADDPRAREEYEDARALFEAVIAGMQVDGPFPTNFLKRFGSLGPLPDLARATGADALLFVHGADYVTTEGRVAAKAAGTVVASVLCLASLLYLWPACNAAVVVAMPDPATLTAALVEARTGDLLWLQRVSSRVDLQDPENATKLTSELLSSFSLSEARR